MLGLLPLISILTAAFAAAVAVPGWGWRRAFLRSSLALGAYMVLATEGLSLLGGVTRLGLSLVWALPALLALAWLVTRIRSGGPIALPHWPRPDAPLDWMIFVGLGIIIATTAVIAWVSPPNTWDSLTYHMARVAHWAQNHSLAPFATGNERQNFMAPAGEMAMLQLYVLAGGDRLVNFVQWLSMLGSILIVTKIAKDLGASRLGQAFSAVFVATLPMGIAQASSTMTDYVVAFWMVCLMSESLSLATHKPHWMDLVFIALAAALAINTKPTALAFLLPFLAYVAIVLFRKFRFGEVAALSLTALAIVSVINAGYFSRNMSLYGTPLGSSERISNHANNILDWRVFVSNVLRNASLHAGTPSPHVNKGIALTIAKIHDWIGLGTTDPRTSAHLIFRVQAPSTNEAKAGNPAQAALILLVSVLILLRRKSLNPAVFGLAAVVAGSFLVISLMFKFTVFGSRYHLPFFVLYAPVAGYVLSALIPPNGVRLVALGLCLITWPWLVHLDPRPLVSSESTDQSILSQPRDDLYFILDPSAEQPYREMVSAIQGASCSSVGTMLSGGAAEYPLWAMLGAPRDDLVIEAIVAGTASARFSKPAFQPCAVVCDGSCPKDLVDIRGLTRVYGSEGYRLYLKEAAPPPP